MIVYSIKYLPMFSSSSLFSPSQTLTVTPFFFIFLSEGWFRVNFYPKITSQSCFSLYPIWITDFTYFLFSFVCFCDFVVSEMTLFVLISRLCAVCFWFSVLVYSVYLIQVERLALSKCRSDQWKWLWRRQRCNPETWIFRRL